MSLSHIIPTTAMLWGKIIIPIFFCLGLRGFNSPMLTHHELELEPQPSREEAMTAAEEKQWGTGSSISPRGQERGLKNMCF